MAKAPVGPYRVRRPFDANGKKMIPGEVIDVTEWRNAFQLVDRGFLEAIPAREMADKKLTQKNSGKNPEPELAAKNLEPEIATKNPEPEIGEKNLEPEIGDKNSEPENSDQNSAQEIPKKKTAVKKTAAKKKTE